MVAAKVPQLPADVLARYSTTAPRYTSYPTALVWRDLPETEALDVLDRASRTKQPLSLYAHLPFCWKLCYYCGCNMMVTRNPKLVERYLAALTTEIGRATLEHRPVTQIHWGGGTPTYLNSEQLTRLFNAMAERFKITPDAEISIEVHPPVTTLEQVKTLARLGFNRVSMGVQDFDPVVQEAVHRIQPFEQTRDLIQACRDAGFRGVSIDLMYGLPHQTPTTFQQTLDKVEQLRPDRIALFGYAHMPWIKPHQSLIQASALPTPPHRLELFRGATARLLSLGYEYVGLDHFALPHDELVVARSKGKLQRNFMGYTTQAGTDLLAFGASSISDVHGAYLQNAREVPEYMNLVESNRLPITRGMTLSQDDLIRRDLIQALFCQLSVDKARFSALHGISFDEYFAPELRKLAPLQEDGLVELHPESVSITPTGQMLLRNIAYAFDAYAREPGAPGRYSQTV
ncbi:MAG: oxygen-independent coproporphyrinogen III oxidase [Myxococcota bacterium]